MLIANAKLRLPYGALSNIMDIGSYYALGSQILRKDLTPTPTNKAFLFPTLSTGLDTPVIWGRDATNVAPLALSGSVAQVQNYNSSTGADLLTLSASAGSQFELLPTYIDSTMGLTAGKRLVFYAPNSISSINAGVVDAFGEVTWLNNLAASPTTMSATSKLCVLGESSAHIYLLGIRLCDSQATANGTYGGMHAIIQYNKITNVSVVMGPASNAQGSTTGIFLRYLCRTDDGKIWFSAQTTYGSGPGSSGTSGYYVLDPNAASLTYSSMSTYKMAATLATNNNGIFSTSQATICANDATKYKAYWPIDPDGNTNGNMTIKLAYIPKTGQATALGFIPSAQVACTLIDGDMPVAYSVGSGGSLACQVDMWLFNDNGNEYLAVLYHSVTDQSSPQVSYNRVSIGNQAIYVYKIDPTDPTKLTFKSVVRDNGFGTGLLFGPFVKSTDGKTVVMGSSTGFVVLGFNSTTESFVYGTMMRLPVLRFALDQDGMLWTEDFNKNLYIFNPVNSNNIVVTFDVPKLAYAGQPLTANAIVNSYDFYGNRQVASVSLNIEGGLFTASSETSIAVTTSATADTLVPITINASGTVVVTPVI